MSPATASIGQTCAVMALREKYKEKFKEQNPAMEQDELQDAAEMWDEHKDTVKEKWLYGNAARVFGR